MDQRQTGLLATIATALLCGCPGLMAFCWGSLAALAGLTPGSTVDIAGNTNPQSALVTGLGTLCVGIVFIAIPVVVGVVTLRRRSEPILPDEPIPPAS